MRLSFGVLLTEYISKRFSINKRKCHQILVLIVTFFIYAVYHMSRRSISIVKPEFDHNDCSEYEAAHPEIQPANNSYWCNRAPFNVPEAQMKLGWLDTSYLISYAIFMFIAGYVAERCDLRYFLTASLIVCGIFNILFGIARPLHIHSYYYFVVIQVLSGIAQTTGWPAVVTAVGNWFGHTKKGLIFGIWSWHTSLGNIVGSAVAGAFVDYNWSLSFIVPGIICIGMAVITFLFLIPGPQYVGLSPEDNHLSDKMEENNCKGNDESDNEAEAISFFGAIKLPGVIEFSICLFFAKLVSYTLLYWLPSMINDTIEVTASESAYLSISFDIGGAIGAMLAGYIADKTDASAVTCIGFLIAAIPSLFAFKEWGPVSMVSNQCLQFIAGLFVNGPYALITTAVSADLATKVKSKSALATVSAIIDGTGSIGAAVGPGLAGYLNSDNVFYMVMISDFLAILSLLRISFNEWKKVYSQRRAKRKEKQINRFTYKL